MTLPMWGDVVLRDGRKMLGEVRQMELAGQPMLCIATPRDDGERRVIVNPGEIATVELMAEHSARAELARRASLVGRALRPVSPARTHHA
jgi:sugar/nucleoside kinase (ribokinase family)